MKVLIDENVSLGLATLLRGKGFTVIAIAEIAEWGISDEEVWSLVKEQSSLLITRDYHFTNPTRFDSSLGEAIIFIRSGNLTSTEEINLVEKFISNYSFENYKGKLVTLSKKEIKIR